MASSRDLRTAEHDGSYDAFLSHSSADRKAVSRVQAFLESYSFGTPKRRVKAFRDYSDLPAGELSHEIERALTASRFLIVVSSPAAADSRWVDKEVRAFDAIHRDPSRIAVAVLTGPTHVEVIQALTDREYLRHDLAKGWIFGIPRLRTRLELLRILAMVTGQSMRSLVRWHLLRTLRNWSFASLIALVPFVVFMFQQIAIWEQIPAISEHGRVYAIAAEVHEGGDDALSVTYRFRAQGPQGFRNYFAVTDYPSKSRGTSQIRDAFDTRRRLLPKAIVDRRVVTKCDRPIAFEALTGRKAAGEAFLGMPKEGHFVVVQPLALTQEELDEASDNMVEFSVPVPKSNGSVIVTVSPLGTTTCVVNDLNPIWQDRDGMGNPTSPSMGLPIVWDEQLGIWLGAPGWNAQSAGGLWRSLDLGRSWHRVGGFKSVNSVGVIVEDGSRCIVVLELHFDTWNGIILVPYPSRAVLSKDGGVTWIAAETPPFGSKSEIEFSGTLSTGCDVFRIDENLFQRKLVLRWQSLSIPNNEIVDMAGKAEPVRRASANKAVNPSGGQGGK